MLELLIDSINVKTLTMLSAAIAAVATVLTLAMPLVFADSLGKRMKAVAVEREKIRQRERERMAQAQQKVNLRPSAKQSVQTIVEQFNLKKWVGQEEARLKLVQAGYRGQAPYVTYLFFRMVTPAASALLAAVYLFVILDLHQPGMVKLGDLHCRSLCRHACTADVPQEPDRASPTFDQTRIPRYARPAADLRGIRHVDRGRVQKGER